MTAAESRKSLVRLLLHVEKQETISLAAMLTFARDARASRKPARKAARFHRDSRRVESGEQKFLASNRRSMRR